MKILRLCVTFLVSFSLFLTSYGAVLAGPPRPDYPGPDPRSFCAQVDNVVKAYYPDLSYNYEISKTGLIAMMETRWVNYRNGQRYLFHNLNHRVRNNGKVVVKPPKKEVGNCAMLFTQANDDVVRYMGVHEFYLTKRGKPRLKFHPGNDTFGTVMVVVQQDWSLTPYQAIY